jgi:hypothetical protein
MGLKSKPTKTTQKGKPAAKPAASPLAQSLLNRQWPDPVDNVIIGDYDNCYYVNEGRVFTRALRMHQSVSPAIPPSESGVTALATGANGKIYGATSGARSHLFFYDPSPAGDGVGDLGVLPGVKSAVRTLVAPTKGLVFVGASEMIDAKASGPLFVHETAIDYMDEFRTYCGPIRQAAVPVKGECIAALCASPAGDTLYGLSSVTGTFFRFDVASSKVTLHGKVSKDRAFSRFLVTDSSGCVFGTHSLGTLFRFDPGNGKIEDLGVKIPTVAGREFYNQLDTAALNPNDGCIYGGGTADGMLFRLDPSVMDIRCLGKATAEARVRAIACVEDGRVFGISGDPGGMGHLFCYDPHRHELRDLGLLMAASEVWRRGFEFDAACVGLNGEIYFGENEREGHLFMYFPKPGSASPRYGIPF